MYLDEVKHTFVAGLKTACLSRAQLVALIAQRVSDYCTTKRQDNAQGRRPPPMLVFDSNGQGISIAASDKQFKGLLEQADVIHADGQSVVNMSHWFGANPIPERSATTDTIHDIPNMYPLELRHFLLGGHPGVADACADLMMKQHANFRCVGTAHGYFNLQEETALIERINTSCADILWVGLGKPREQEFCVRNRHKIRVPVMITCGGCYHYVTGDYARAPAFMQRTGFEWLFRVMTEPRKFFWRYLTTNPHAIYCAFKYRKANRQEA